MIAVWFDPGKLTGVCAVDTVTGTPLLIDEYNLPNTGGVLEPRIQMFNGPEPLIGAWNMHQVAVGWETYRIMKGPQTQAPWSLEVIGMLRYLCEKYGYTQLTPAEPGEREVCSPSILKAIGWYPRVKGKKDALSAAQHTVAWWLRTDTLPEQYHDAIYGALR